MDDRFGLSVIEDRAEWSRLMNQSRKADLQQTWAYGESVRKCIGWEPIRHLITDNGRPAAMTQTLIKEIPIVGHVARMQHGPVFLESHGHFSPENALGIIEFLRHHWVDGKNTVLHLTPCLVRSDLPERWAETMKNMGLDPSDEALWRSIRIDLTQQPEKIHKNMKRNWRKSLRKAEEYCLGAETGESAADFDFFMEKYEQAVAEKGISWPSPELVRELKTQAGSDMHLVFVIKDGERIAGMVMIVYASVAHCLVAWSDSRADKLRANNFLYWQFILRFREMGCSWYDVGGIDPDRLPGITVFKRGMSGEEYHLAGNFVARPPGAGDRMRQTDDYRLGHVLSGLALPGPDAEAVKARVKTVISEFVREKLSDTELDENLSLIDGGLIDSFTLVSVVQVLQEKFDIEIMVQDINIENFDTIQGISEFVKSKMEEG